MPIIKIKGGKEALEYLRNLSQGKCVYRQRKDGSVVMARLPRRAIRRRKVAGLSQKAFRSASN